MDLIVQPADGLAPLLGAIHRAQKYLDFIIFRLDLKDIGPAPPRPRDGPRRRRGLRGEPE
ncbi:MAG: hypothetical protein A3F70_01425 [Acidobacteria bacterium RIFCSPLOWO2_12_FULL_67_14]|nr:MAG: hypothetical protein A3H29_02085 [Acidobacteria bacterium RIFCSPLOWO2_02_FULL_67_21]OFW38453.1 MAG: hypothetical protein A3F70_01425 [Acidobacteria bacterium RIFCSPLOWO2_12_FULL_67_14]